MPVRQQPRRPHVLRLDGIDRGDAGLGKCQRGVERLEAATGRYAWSSSCSTSAEVQSWLRSCAIAPSKKARASSRKDGPDPPRT